MQAQQQRHAVVHSPQQDPSAEDRLLQQALAQGVELQQQDPVELFSMCWPAWRLMKKLNNP